MDDSIDHSSDAVIILMNLGRTYSFEAQRLYYASGVFAFRNHTFFLNDFNPAHCIPDLASID